MAVKREKVNANRRKSRLQAIKKAEAKLRKRTFFDPTYDIVFKKLFEKTETLVHFLNAILHLEGEHRFVYAEAIKARRSEIGMTLQELADICKMPQSAIARIESGDFSPSLSTFLAICEALELKFKLES